MVDLRGMFVTHPCDTLDPWQTSCCETLVSSTVGHHTCDRTYARPIRFDPPWAPPTSEWDSKRKQILFSMLAHTSISYVSLCVHTYVFKNLFWFCCTYHILRWSKDFAVKFITFKFRACCCRVFCCCITFYCLYFGGRCCRRWCGTDIGWCGRDDFILHLALLLRNFTTEI